jgi:hypothetical protein
MIAGMNKKRFINLFLYIVLIIFAAFLIKHSILWQVIPFEKYPTYNNLGLNIYTISINDILYKTVTQISFLISAITIIIISLQMLKYYKRQFF